MKTIFTSDEILDYISSLNLQLQGENILYNSHSKMFLEEDIQSPKDALKYVQDLGRAEGMMYGKIEMIESLIEFFQLKEK
jgi:hypothetical protein